uniref:Uncharacterized protein n=1 Tax=Rhizophora mucronata TaxID=61149 RepID=A0A2P2MXH3_RHIMU
MSKTKLPKQNEQHNNQNAIDFGFPSSCQKFPQKPESIWEYPSSLQAKTWKDQLT